MDCSLRGSRDGGLSRIGSIRRRSAPECDGEMVLADRVVFPEESTLVSSYTDSSSKYNFSHITLTIYFRSSKGVEMLDLLELIYSRFSIVFLTFPLFSSIDPAIGTSVSH